MRKVLMLAVAIILACSVIAVGPVSADRRKTDQQENIVVRINGDATEADGDDWLYVGSADDDEKTVTIKNKGGCTAYLGIYMDELSRKTKRTYDYPKDDGVLVIEVIDGSPADEAGLEEDDIIFLFDGEEVESGKQLSSLVKEKKPGDEVAIVLYRDGDKQTIAVTLGEYPHEISIDLHDIEDYAEEIGDFAGRFGKSLGFWWQGRFGPKGRLGVELSELDEDLAGYFNVEAESGVLILRVHEDTPAEEAGFRPGDVIVAIDGEGVSEVADVVDELGDIDDEAFEIDVVRKGKKLSLNVELEEEDYFHFTPSEGKRKIVIPPKHFDSVDKLEMEEELDELKKELRELKKRLKELEKE
jgi:C-terminal processing protease CtpA/Prc